MLINSGPHIKPDYRREGTLTVCHSIRTPWQTHFWPNWLWLTLNCPKDKIKKKHFGNPVEFLCEQNPQGSTWVWGSSVDWNLDMFSWKTIFDKAQSCWSWRVWRLHRSTSAQHLQDSEAFDHLSCLPWKILPVWSVSLKPWCTRGLS